MKSIIQVIGLFVIVLLLVVGALVLLTGKTQVSRDAHPPCNQLPTVVEATQALEAHQNLADEVKALGDNISVEVGKPCSEDQNRGLIIVSYHSESERTAIGKLLSEREGFGAPVYLEKR